jgi:hypothetical protein
MKKLSENVVKANALFLDLLNGRYEKGKRQELINQIFKLADIPENHSSDELSDWADSLELSAGLSRDDITDNDIRAKIANYIVSEMDVIDIFN